MSEVPSQHKKLPTSSACMAASQFSALPTIRMMSCFFTAGLSPSPEPFSRATSPLVRVSSLGTATTAAGNSGWITVDTTSKSLDYNQSTPMIVISAISTKPVIFNAHMDKIQFPVIPSWCTHATIHVFG